MPMVSKSASFYAGGSFMKERSSFTGGIGFVLASSASAVGLGNLWRFPYLAAQYGGGIFILVYIILALTFGFALMTTEIAIGRKTRLSPVAAYKVLNKRFAFLNYLAVLVPAIILPYYCVIGGWVIKYTVVFCSGQTTAAASDTFFGEFIGGTTSPLVYFVIFLALTMLVIILGVEKGIEKVSKVMLPVLIVLAIAISIYVLTIPGSGEGLKYYLMPDLPKFSLKTVCAAMGQMFFSMSLAMGIMVTYGSYAKDEVSLTRSTNQIEIFDTLVALLAGLMVIPAVYVFSGEAGLESSGPGLMFVTLPKVFDQMAAGTVIGALFFILVFLAALTSSISLMESLVSCLMDKFHIERKKGAVMVFIWCIILGIPSSLGNGPLASIKILGMDFLTFFDFLSNSVLMPLVALFTCILIGWVVGTDSIVNEVTKNGERLRRKTLYEVVIKYVAPVLLVVILVFYTMAQFGIIKY